MLELYKKKDSLPPSAEREKVEREIAVTDEKIDDIVYWLYGITEEERGMIEGGDTLKIEIEFDVRVFLKLFSFFWESDSFFSFCFLL